MTGRTSVVAGLVAGVAAATVVIACKGPASPSGWEVRLQKHNEISALWTQVRGWRKEANMDLDPAPQSMSTVRDKRVRELIPPCAAAKPRACDEVCSLADAICDNAEAICGIADELGPNDDFAQQKCASAKASCVEAKQRCCTCSTNPPEAP